MALAFTSGGSGGGAGTVKSVTAGDTSIVVGGTATDPTIETADLSTIAADHATAGDVAMNAHKVTGLANGAAASDAAALGQVGVTSLAADDTSVVVAGTAAAPTVRTATLDVIAADHPAAADWSNNSHKITSLGNGAAAQDAAAFGQIPTALPPNGAAGGDLAGTYPNPTVGNVAILTTKGDLLYDSAAGVAARLAIGAAGQFLGVAGGVPSWATLPFAQLFDSTLGADTASIDTGANGVAQTYSHLLCVAIVRTTQAVAASDALWRLNNDSGANYDRETLRARSNATSSGAVAAATSVDINVPGSSNAASHFAGSALFLPAYIQTVAHKVLVEMGGWADTAIANSEAHINVGNWRNTAAVTRVSITAGSGNLLTGSRLTIYGIA